MKRTELVDRLIKEGFSIKTLVKFNDNQLSELASRMLGEEAVMISKNSPNFQKDLDMAKKSNKTIETYEELKGGQKKIDKNKNGKIDAEDFAILNKEKKSEVKEVSKKCDDCGKAVKNCSCDHTHMDEEKKMSAKKCDDCGKEIKKCKCDHSHMDESKQVKNWIKGLVENKKFHSFTSKNEIMELIQTKLNESDTMVQHGPKVKKGHNGVPEFMTYDAITSSDPAVAPSKPKTSPTTKPGEKPSRPKRDPFNPGPKPSPAPKATFAENAPLAATGKLKPRVSNK